MLMNLQCEKHGHGQTERVKVARGGCAEHGGLEAPSYGIVRCVLYILSTY
jgi:hypothetical protein